MSRQEFEVGDDVEILEGAARGEVGTVVSVSGRHRQIVRVKLDGWLRGHQPMTAPFSPTELRHSQQKLPI